MTPVRITHAGSLPRPPGLVGLHIRKSRREGIDESGLAAAVDEATRAVVSRQLEIGIDVANDGEQSRESFFTYVQHRMTGFGDRGSRPVMADLARTEGYLEAKAHELGRPMVDLLRTPKAIGPVSYVDTHAVEIDCRRFHRTVAGLDGDFGDYFMTAASPGIIAAAMENEFYDSWSDYLRAVTDALRPEYEHIVSRGFILQIDAPDLAMERHTSFADRPLRAFLDFVSENVAAINRAIERIPPDRVRLHVCWGNYEGPHDRDVPLAEILPQLYDAYVGGLLLPFANPRHAHEVEELARHSPPDRLSIVAGVIDTTTSYVEHPDLVAERIERVCRAIGDPERVLAGTDCGFDTAAGLGRVPDAVVWAKLASLRAGADRALA